MKAYILALAVSLAMIPLAQAQTYKDSGGTIVPAVVPLNCPPGGGTCTGPSAPAPYAFTPLTGAQYNQAATTSTSLTIPTGALYARICAMGGTMNFADDAGGSAATTGSSPTVGTPLAAGSCILEQGASVLSAFRIINAVASTGTWNAVYFK